MVSGSQEGRKDGWQAVKKAGRQEGRLAGGEADHDQFELCLAHFQGTHLGDLSSLSSGGQDPKIRYS